MGCGNVTVHACSGTHHATTLATTDAESYELSRCVATTYGVRDLMTEMGFPQLLPSPINCDNSGSVRKAASAGSDKRSPYLKRRVKFIEEAQAKGATRVAHIPTEYNLADILTKSLPAKLYKKFRDAIMNVRVVAQHLHSMIVKEMPIPL